MPSCRHCGAASFNTAKAVGYCAACISEGKNFIYENLNKMHMEVRKKSGVPFYTPQAEEGVFCPVCCRGCRPTPGEIGYCGLKENRDGKLIHLAGVSSKGLLEYFFDSLPTNCVASFVCPAVKSPYSGIKNLAVFYGACNLNCLFCQNWHYRLLTKNLSPLMSASELAAKVDEETACICFFGGDPGPQVPHALSTVSKALIKKPDLKICWETSGCISDFYFSKILNISYKSGGTVKFDFKAYNNNLYFALTGGDNKHLLKNFAKCASLSYEKGVDLAVASTLLVPGYISEKEVYDIASFIAHYNPWTPYSLLAFYPHFYMKDLPLISRKEAEACYFAAQKAGLRRVNLSNEHLLS